LSVVWKQGKQSFFNNDLFRSVVFLDPRYEIVLFSYVVIKIIWIVLTRFFFLLSDNDKRLAKVFLGKKHQAHWVLMFLKSLNCRMIFNTCHDWHLNILFLDYWEQQKYAKPKLFKLSQIILAFPVTQVSVERAFSGLHFVLNPLRTSLEPDVLEDILFVRINHLFEQSEK
jgi:hAT family C-terminal dimerisation region